MLPASRWFILVAAIAILAMVGLALIAAHLQAAIPVDSPQALRLAGFVRAADAGLLLLLGFAIVPPAIRCAARLLAMANPSARGSAKEHARCRTTDLVTLGIWVLGAAGVVLALPPLTDLVAMAALFSQS